MRLCLCCPVFICIFILFVCVCVRLFLREPLFMRIFFVEGRENEERGDAVTLCMLHRSLTMFGLFAMFRCMNRGIVKYTNS